ncbi:hypothetical protein [Pseudogemmobacter humi]|uniref:Uncharacterized protein n=1 Tax=Pseudogemmobacter humi TaxID=2483812 RepID=A0A3P5X8C2_9RHOB|nr:hypothetical protein [Pseudogemmobacter humi]VDC27479.1 hypothetical protein XINFAN_01894 [Pseudogemmobacter humi]
MTTVTDKTDFSKILGEGEIVRFTIRWSKTYLFWMNLLAALFYLMAFGGLAEPSTRGAGLGFLGFAIFISVMAHQAWRMRLVIITDQRLVFWAGLTNSITAIPLNKIESVERSPGLVLVRAGSLLNTLRLSVPDAPALESAIEAARAGIPHREAAAAPVDELAVQTDKTTDTLKEAFTRQSEPPNKLLAFVLLGLAGGSIGYCVAGGSPSQTTSVMDGLTEPSSASAKITPSSNKRANPSSAPLVPINTLVPEKIDTGFLAECWRDSVRGTPAWLETGDLNGDILARYIGRGGVNVRVEVVGNRINTQTLELVGTTHPGSSETITYIRSHLSEGLTQRDAEEIYQTAVRALTNCGTNEIPQPNGVVLLTFDPGRNDIPVQPAGVASQAARPVPAAGGPIPDVMDTDPLMLCWMRDIRGAKKWKVELLPDPWTVFEDV